MVPKLPRATVRKVVRVLRKHGFSVTRHTGGHQIWRDPAGHRVTVPMHGNQDVDPRLLTYIIEQSGIALDEFVRGL